MESYWTLIDIITVVAGVFLIVAPAKAYNFGRKEHKDVPKNWTWQSRVLGAVFIALGAFFFYVSHFRQ